MSSNPYFSPYPVYQQYPNYPTTYTGTPFGPYPNYLNLPNNIITYPGPQAINAPNSPYTYNPFFDGYYAHNLTTDPYSNYLFDIVHSFQNEAIRQTPGSGFWPLPQWGGNFY
jgi:hypothetical protein